MKVKVINAKTGEVLATKETAYEANKYGVSLYDRDKKNGTFKPEKYAVIIDGFDSPVEIEHDLFTRRNNKFEYTQAGELEEVSDIDEIEEIEE